jgi:adenosine deaminase
MFSTTLNREYEIAADLLGLDELGLAELAKTAVRASFADETVKNALCAEIDAYAEKVKVDVSAAKNRTEKIELLEAARQPKTDDAE